MTGRLAHVAFPEGRRRQCRSIYLGDRLNEEIKRRTDVVGILPGRTAGLRLAGIGRIEQDGGGLDGRR